MGELTRKGQSRPVTQEELALYSQAKSLQTEHRVPLLQRATNSHEYLYFPLFDGTGQDVKNPQQLPTNIGALSTQLEPLSRDPRNRIGHYYVQGIGTQDSDLLRVYDGLRPFTWDEKIEEGYRALCIRAKEWKGQDPEAQIRIAHVGYSRGAVLAAGLARLVDRYGIADPQSLNFGRDVHGNITVASQRPLLVPAGEAAQAMGLFDPVATNMPRNYDARPAPSVISAYSQLAVNERRVAFPHQEIVDAELTANGAFLRVPMPGGHSNVGGGNRESGLEALAFNGMVDYLNSLRDQPLFTYRPLPDDPALYTVYQARGVTAVPGLDGDGVRDVREDLANCSIVDPCRDAEPMNESLAAQFEYRTLQPSAPMPVLSTAQTQAAPQDTPVAERASAELDRILRGAPAPSAPNAAITPDHSDHPQHGLLLQIREQVREREREGAIQFRDDPERERFCRYALAACRDNRDELRALYPGSEASGALSGEGLDRATHVVIGTKQYAFIVQGDVRDPLAERVTFTMDRARQTPIEQSDLKLARVNQDIAQQKESGRLQEQLRTPEDSLKPVLAR